MGSETMQQSKGDIAKVKSQKASGGEDIHGHNGESRLRRRLHDFQDELHGGREKASSALRKQPVLTVAVASGLGLVAASFTGVGEAAL